MSFWDAILSVPAAVWAFFTSPVLLTIVTGCAACGAVLLWVIAFRSWDEGERWWVIVLISAGAFSLSWLVIASIIYLGSLPNP